MIALPWKKLCANFILPCGENHYGFFLRCPTSFYNRPKEKISVEVAFNHGEAIAWNLIKPVLASELNHVAKDIQTSAGIIICATNGMKKAGNFDSAVGSYEKFLRYLLPLQNMLPTPILIIGLDAPDSFHVDKTSRQIVMHRA